MKKTKVLVLVLVMATVAATAGFSWGIGAAAGISPLGGLPGSNVMLSVAPPEIPIVFGVGLAIGENTFQVGITADWWLVNQNLFSFVNLYVGPGLYVGISNGVDLGARVPVGINIWPLDFLEIFLEIAPTLGIQFADPIVFPRFALQGSFGLRFWF